MQKRSSIIGGIILIVLGGIFLLLQLFPSFADQFDIGRQWPLIIIAAGGFFLLSSFLGTPALAVPGCVIGGIGGILYYQNLSGNWASWAYVWALIPGFAGIGTILMGLLGDGRKTNVREGGRLVLISLIMFAIFGAFFNGLGGIGQYWPVLLILLGGWLLFTNRK